MPPPTAITGLRRASAWHGVLLVFLLFFGCEQPQDGGLPAGDEYVAPGRDGNAGAQYRAAPPGDTEGLDAGARAAVRTGAEVLASREFDLLAGMRVGLIVNHTAVVGTEHLLDLVHSAPDVRLTALFGPEHGIRGTADAGARIAHGRDDVTGVPIYSLYGETRKPTPEMLRDVDVLVFDIQDVGARFYTYISTMGLAMQAAAENDVAFIVLDRPNPLGGTLVSGFMLEPQFESFVGQYVIPMVHGLTVGELALLVKGEGLMPGLANLDLRVVEMEGWQREMLWPDTGLPWSAPSPNIPDFETALIYPGTVLFEATSESEGRGTLEPFKQVGAPWADGAELARTLNARGLPGVRFEPAVFTPVSINGMASRPKLEGRRLQGIKYVLTDVRAFLPVESGIHVFQAFFDQSPGPFVSRPDWLARLSGSERLLSMLERGVDAWEISQAWSEDVSSFREQRASYLLY